MTRDMSFALGMLILSAIMFRETLGFPPGSAFRAAPATFPRFLLVIIVTLSVLLLVRSVVMERATLRVDVAGVARTLRDYWMVSAMFALFAFYVAGMRMFGFVPATLVFLMVGQIMIARRLDLRSLAIAATITVVATLSIHYVFTQALRIWLP